MVRVICFLAVAVAAWPCFGAEGERDAEIRRLRAENKLLRATVARLGRENDALEAELKSLRRRVDAKTQNGRRNASKGGATNDASAPRRDAQKRSSGRDKYTFTPLPGVRVSPRFELGSGLSMGNWSCRAWKVTNKETGKQHVALELHVEVQPEGVSLPPLSLKAQAKSKANQLVGQGMLLAMRVDVMEKLPYQGLIVLESLDVDVIALSKGM